MTFPFVHNFRTLSYKIPYDFLKFNFSHFSRQVKLGIFRRKRNPKSFGFENVMERGMRAILTFIKL